MAWCLAAEGFIVSPPEETRVEETAGEWVRVDLRQMEDIVGLAWFVEDEEAALVLEAVLQEPLAAARSVVAQDATWQRLDRQLADTFRDMFADRLRPAADIAVEIERFPLERTRKIIAGWLRKVFWQAGVFLETDSERLTETGREELCQKLRARLEPKNFEPWRLRVLLWQLRDREALHLHHQRDEREAELTTVRLELSRRQAPERQLVRRYLEVLRRLRLLAALRGGDDAESRTLRGFLRGLRYVPTIRQACQQTGLDYRLITRLLIQESAFVHQRMSYAGAYSLAQFLDIALKDIWLFRRAIPGAAQILREVESFEQLRQQVIDDPHWAIRAACVYFRRLRDEAQLRLGSVNDENMLTIMSLELFLVRQGLSERGEMESLLQLALAEQEIQPPTPLLPLWPGGLADAGPAVSGWVKSAVRQLAARRLSEELFRERLDQLYQALGLAAYNAGMGNLRRTADRLGPVSRLAFPLQIAETRTYINEVLNGRDFLGRIQQEISPLKDMDYAELARLATGVCTPQATPRNRIAHPDSHQNRSTADLD